MSPTGPPELSTGPTPRSPPPPATPAPPATVAAPVVALSPPRIASSIPPLPSVAVSVPTLAPSPARELDITEDQNAGPALVTIKELRTTPPLPEAPKQLGAAQTPVAAKELPALPLPIAPKQVGTAPPVIAAKENPGTLSTVAPKELAPTPNVVRPKEPIPAPTTLLAAPPITDSSSAAQSSATPVVSPITPEAARTLLADPPAPEAQPADKAPADPKPTTPAVTAAAPAAPKSEARSSPKADVTTEARRPVESKTATASPLTVKETKSGGGSPLGVGFGGLTIRLDGPRSRITEQPTAMVSGRIVLGTAPRILLQVNDGSKDITADGRTFRAPVTLRPGSNVVRVIASDAEGHESEDVVIIEYRPPVVATGIVLTSPQDGHTLTASDVPIVVMEGEVDNPRVTRVRLFANDSRVTVPVVDRRFRQVIPVLEPLVRLRAESADASDSVTASATVTVRGPGAPTAGVFVMNWTATPLEAHPEVMATFRARSDRPDVSAQPVTVESVASRVGAPKDVFLLRKMQPGVYTFVLRYASTPGASAMPLLYLGRAGAPTAHPLAPLMLAGSGRTNLARILLPHGVLWDQDDWFSGKSESADTITKVRLPEGVTWTERKATAK